MHVHYEVYFFLFFVSTTNISVACTPRKGVVHTPRTWVARIGIVFLLTCDSIVSTKMLNYDTCKIYYMSHNNKIHLFFFICIVDDVFTLLPMLVKERCTCCHVYEFTFGVYITLGATHTWCMLFNKLI